MLRHGNPAENVLAYATFFALSIAVHLIVILGTRSPGAPAPTGSPSQPSEQVTRTDGARPAATTPQRRERPTAIDEREALVSAREATR